MLTRPAGPRTDDLESERPRALALFAVAEGLVALVALIGLGLTVPIRDAIAIPLLGLSLGTDRLLGAAFWVCLGLFGSLRASPRPGGSVLTFSPPSSSPGSCSAGRSSGS